MSHIEQTIETLAQEVAEREKEIKDTQRVINSLCRKIGKPDRYVIEDASQEVAVSNLRGDEFYGQPLAKVVRTILLGSKASGAGAMSVPEIFKSMKAGGFEFDTKNDENAHRGLHISLAKNTAVFHKLPNGKFVLREWYPTIKDKPVKSAKQPPGPTNATDEEVDEHHAANIAAAGQDANIFNMDEKEKQAEIKKPKTKVSFAEQLKAARA